MVETFNSAPDEIAASISLPPLSSDQLKWLTGPLDSNRKPLPPDLLRVSIAALITGQIAAMFDGVGNSNGADVKREIFTGILAATQILAEPTDDDPTGAKRLRILLGKPDVCPEKKIGLKRGAKRFFEIQRQLLTGEGAVLD